jgi:hypothetical protein
VARLFASLSGRYRSSRQAHFRLAGARLREQGSGAEEGNTPLSFVNRNYGADVDAGWLWLRSSETSRYGGFVRTGLRAEANLLTLDEGPEGLVTTGLVTVLAGPFLDAGAMF